MQKEKLHEGKMLLIHRPKLLAPLFCHCYWPRICSFGIFLPLVFTRLSSDVIGVTGGTKEIFDKSVSECHLSHKDRFRVLVCSIHS